MKNLKYNSKNFNNINNNKKNRLFNVLYKTPKKILLEKKKILLPEIQNKNDFSESKNSFKIYKKIPEIEKFFNINDKLIDNLKSKESMGLFEANFSSFSKDYNHRKNCLSLRVNKNKKTKGILNLKNAKNKKHIQFVERKSFRLKSSPIRKSNSNTFFDDNQSNLSIEIPPLPFRRKPKKKSSTLSANFKYKKDYLKIKTIKSISSLSSYVNPKNEEQKPFQLHRTSVLDKLILKITNPDEIFEDYLLDNRPGDKYIRFKRNLKKQKVKVEKLLIDLRASQKKADFEIKNYNPKNKLNKNHFNNKYI